MQGLVLEGGGARGAYQIGAYKALTEEGYTFNGVSGTSIGALNGALIVQGDAARAYELWEDLHPSELFGVPLNSWNLLMDGDFQFSDIPELFKTLQSIVRSKGLDIQKVKALLRKVIIEEKLRKSLLDFGFVTYSLSDRKTLEYYKEDIPQEEMIDYLMSSANLPIFQMEKLGGKILIDGGVSNNKAKDFLKSIKAHPKAQKIFHPTKKLPTLLIQNEIGARVFKNSILQEIAWFIVNQGASA